MPEPQHLQTMYKPPKSQTKFTCKNQHSNQGLIMLIVYSENSHHDLLSE